MHKKVVILLLLLLLSWTTLGERKKVGVVLSGGGALGVAHIGVLKVLEEAGMPIDYITGTSMGALVGALYAIGYDAHALDSMVRIQNWRYLLSNRLYRSELPFYEKEQSSKYLISLPIKGRKIEVPSGVLGGQNIYNLFMELTVGYHDSISYSTLPIPFACVATNILTGKPHVMHSGILPLSMRSSMAIPGIFAPMHIDSLVLVDGGIANNFPVNICQEMGADILIGIDLNTGSYKAADINSATSVMDQMIDLLGNSEYQKNKAILLSDPDKYLYLNPNLQGYTIASFYEPAIDSMIQLGERVARANWDKIIALKQKAGVAPYEDASPHIRNNFLDNQTIVIENIEIEGVPQDEHRWIRNLLRIDKKHKTTYHSINQGINYLYGTGVFAEINYVCQPTGEANHFNLILRISPKRMNSLNFGFRFDTENMAAILLNTTFGGIFLKESRLNVSTRLGLNPYITVNYSFGNEILHGIGLKYKFQYNDLDWYKKGRKVSNVSYVYNMGELSFTTYYRQDFKFKIGFDYEYFDFGSILYAPGYLQDKARSKGFANYLTELHYETINMEYYPTKGVDLKAQYKLHTTNMTTNDGHVPFSSIYFHAYAPLKIAKRFYLIPAVYSRVLIGKSIPFQYLNCMGGEVAARYMPQQIPFMGVHHLELFDNSLINFQAKLRYRIGINNYITLTGNYAKQENDFKNILDGSDLWGGGITLSHNSLFGPINLTFDLSNWDTQLGIYLNIGYYF